MCSLKFSFLFVLLLLLSSLALATDWPQWRGPGRDGFSSEVPAQLSAKQLLWQQPLTGECFAGVAISGGYSVVADHGVDIDVIRCFNAESGKLVWKYVYPCKGDMQYGNAPRATPLIAGGLVYTLGAYGELFALELATGKVNWHLNLTRQFAASVPSWGFCSSPLLAGGKLIINPGGAADSIVALDPKTGATIWEAAGKKAAYASFLAGTFGGIAQVVGYDEGSLGGWAQDDGRRLWTLKPDNEGDFNVGSPLQVGDKLLTATDNNFTRLFAFKDDGSPISPPAAKNGDVGPDMETPTLVGDALLTTTTGGLYCLDATTLALRWKDESELYQGYSSIIAGVGRALALTESGVLVLLAVDAKGCRPLGRLPVCGKTWSYPALANGRLYVRDAKAVYCYRMN